MKHVFASAIAALGVTGVQAINSFTKSSSTSTTTGPTSTTTTTTSTGEFTTSGNDGPDLSEFHGLRIRNDDAIIELGADADIKLVRTDPGRLVLSAEEYHVKGEVHADSVFVGGVDIETLCNCSEPTDVDVRIRTMTAIGNTYAPSAQATNVEFYVPGHHWTPLYRYTQSSAAGEVNEAWYHLPARPTKFRLSNTGEDAWGIAYASIQVEDERPVSVLCSTRVGEIPGRGDNSHWVSTADESNNVPNVLEFAADEAECTSFVSLEAITGEADAGATTNTVYVDFLINGTWTGEIEFFDGSSEGDYEVQDFQLAADPTALRLTISATDAWSYDFLSINVNGEVHVLACEGTQSAPTQDTRHWVEGGSSPNLDAPVEQVWDVEHNECELVNVTLDLHVGDATNSGSDDLVMVQFYDGTNWTENFVLTQDVNTGNDRTLEYRIPRRPAKLRISSYGSNALAIGHLAVSIDGGKPVDVICNPTIGLNAAGDDYWVGGSKQSAFTLDVDESACPVRSTVTLTTAGVDSAGTTNTGYITFHYNSTWSEERQKLFSGTSKNEVNVGYYGLQARPESVTLSMGGSDAFGFDSFYVQLNNETFTIVCEGSEEALAQSSDYWLDGDASAARTSIDYAIVHDDCETTTEPPTTTSSSTTSSSISIA